MAARLTLRCSAHATRARQIRTAAPKAPRAAPTQMNTVPSGRLDFCINGAAWVSGTPTLGIPTPAMVGRPVRWNTERVRDGLPVTLSVSSSPRVVSEVEVSDAAGAFVTLNDDNEGDGRPVSLLSLSVAAADVFSSSSGSRSVVLAGGAVVAASSVAGASVVTVARSGRSDGRLFWAMTGVSRRRRPRRPTEGPLVTLILKNKS